MILVSACLLGVKCRYDGQGKEYKELVERLAGGGVIPVCPEQLGGCPTPRTQCEILGGNGAGVLDGKCRVIGKNGKDVTDALIKGALETLKIASACGVKMAILKARSPSCGFGRIYDGTFTGNMTEGNGVTAELLHRNQIEVFTEETFDGKVGRAENGQ